MDLDRTVHNKMVTEPSISPKVNIMDIDHELSWMDPIIEYISNDNLPSDSRAARNIMSQALRYCIIGGVLFHRNFYLRCFRPAESLQALTKVHEGVCGNH